MGTNSVLPHFLETDQLDFETDVMKVPGFTLVSFYRNSCAYCKAFEPVLAAFAERNAGRVRCVRIEVSYDNDDDFKQQYKILGEPTVHLYHDGKLLYYIRGAAAEPEFTSTVTGGIRDARMRGITNADLELVPPTTGDANVFQLIVPRAPEMQPAPPPPVNTTAG